jgi:chemotaxis protein MotA
VNISVIIGLIVAFGGLIVGYGMDGGNVNALFLVSPFFIVFGGTIGTVIFSFGISGLTSALKAFMTSFLKKDAPNPTQLIEKLAAMSDECRSGGLLKLETMMESDPDLSKSQYLLLKEGMILALDTNTSDQIQEALEADMMASTLKKQMAIEVLEGAGGYSPTMGVIGTVMGLVQVLSNMTDAEALAESIAIAFVATLYGVVFANLIYLPMANNLKCDLKRDKIFKHMIIDGICMVASGENSRNIKNKLALYYQAFPNGEKKYREGINN